MGRGATVAQRTLNPFILVRIRAPQPDNPLLRKAIVSDEFPTKYSELRPTWRAMSDAARLFSCPQIVNSHDK